MQEKFKESYIKFIDAFGQESQVDMCIEEMSELIKELLKYRRVQKLSNIDKNELAIRHANIQEEIADVLNTVEQMAYIFGEEEVNRIREEKINRALTKISASNK